MKKTLIAAAAALVALTACDEGKSTVALEGTQWKLEQMAGIPAAAIEREADFFTLTFNAADKMVNGRTNCNRFFGGYELKGKELDFDNLGMTRMACPEMEYENAFVKMLDEVDSYSIKGETLKFYDDGKELASFKVQPAVQPAAESVPAVVLTPSQDAADAVEMTDSVVVAE